MIILQDDGTKVCDLQELSKLTGKAVKTLRTWAKELRTPPYRRQGNRILFNLEDAQIFADTKFAFRRAEDFHAYIDEQAKKRRRKR